MARQIFLFMKNLFIISALLLAVWLTNAQTPTAAYVKQLEAKYPPVKSSFCTNCYLWVNLYFKAIVDGDKRESLVTYGEFDRHKDSLVTALNIPRTGTYAAWHPAHGFQDEGKFYNDINKTLVKPDEYAKGHYNAWILSAWAVDGALLSDTYDFNEGIERQAQNAGTELEVEYLTRALVGNKDAASRVNYTGPLYDSVKYWKGSWGSKKVFNVDGITKNYSSVYWNLLAYGNQIHAYWFPNDLTGKSGYQKF